MSLGGGEGGKQSCFKVSFEFGYYFSEIFRNAKNSAEIDTSPVHV